MNARSFVTLVSPLALALFLGSPAGFGGHKPAQQLTPTVEAPDAGAAEPGPPPDAGPKSLYDRLGGKDGINAVVEALLKNVAGDPELKKIFAKTTGPKLDAFKKNLGDQLCEVTGGPCKYQGKDMKATHAAMKVTEAQWDKFVSALTASLNEAKVADNEQSELLALLAPMKSEIVAGKKK